MNDLVNKPAHYQSFEIEPIDVLRFAPFCLGNCLKYIIRAEYKGTPELDYAKAAKYLTWCFEEYSDTKLCDSYCNFLENYGLILKKHKLLTSLEINYMKDFLHSIDNILIEKIGYSEEYHKRNDYED